MRTTTPALIVTAVMGLAACGEKDEPSATTPATSEPAPGSEWAGPPQGLGKLDVAAFNAYAANVDERWERSPLLTGAEFARLDRERASTTSVVAKAPPEGGSSARVVVTLDGLLDDSIRATRFVLELERERGTWRLTSATREQRCHEGRGQTGFEPKRCV